MDTPKYTDLELKVMQMMAHGLTRTQIAGRVQGSDGKLISLSTVARLSRSATDKAVPVQTPDGAPAPIVHGICVLVSQGRISVRFGMERGTARETAIAWLDRRIHTCLDWQEFVELRAVYTAMQETQEWSSTS